MLYQILIIFYEIYSLLPFHEFGANLLHASVQIGIIEIHLAGFKTWKTQALDLFVFSNVCNSSSTTCHYFDSFVQTIVWSHYNTNYNNSHNRDQDRLLFNFFMPFLSH